MKSTSKLLVLLVIIIVIGAIAWKTLGSQETTPSETKAAESTAQATPTQESAPTAQQAAPTESTATAQNTAATQESAPATQTEAATASDTPAAAATTETPAADNTSGELTCDKADKIVADIFDMRVGNKSLDEALAYLQNTASLPEQELNAFSQFARGLWGVPIEKIDAKQQVAVFHEQCITLAQQAQQAAQQAEQAAQTEQAKPEQQAPAAQ